MARAGVASASAQLDSIKGLAQSTAQPAYRRRLAELLRSRAVPILIVAFLATICAGTVVQVLEQRHQALNNSIVTLDAVAELIAERIDASLKQPNSAVKHPQDVLTQALPAWALASGRQFVLTNNDGVVIATTPDGNLVGQRLTALLGWTQPPPASSARVLEIALSDGAHGFATVRPLQAPFGQLALLQSRTGALANWRSLATLTTTLSTTTGCVVLILGFAFHWQARRAREADLRYETTRTDIAALRTQKEELIPRERQLTATITNLRVVKQPSAQVVEKYAGETTCEEELNHIKSKFLAKMSHDLRTPLNAIIGFSEIMKSEMFGPLGTDKYREYCSDIHHSGQNLLQVVTDIFEMSEREADCVSLSDSKQKIAQF